MSVAVTESTAQQPPSHLLLHRRSSGRGWRCSLARLVRSWRSRARHQRHELVVTLRPGRPRDPYAGERARSLRAVDEDLRRASPTSGCWHRGEILQYTPVRHLTQQIMQSIVVSCLLLRAMISVSDPNLAGDLGLAPTIRA